MARTGQRPLVNPALSPLLAFVVRHPLLVLFAAPLTASMLVAVLYRPGLAQVVSTVAAFAVTNAAMNRLQRLPHRIPDSDVVVGYCAALTHVVSYRTFARASLRAVPRRARRRLRSALDAAVWSVALEVQPVGRIDSHMAAQLHAPWREICAAVAGVDAAHARLADELAGDSAEVAVSVSAALGADEASVRRYVELCRSGDFAPNPEITYF